MDYKRIRRCRVCGNDDLTRYLDFGKVPLANSLLDSPEDKPSKYPLEVLFCKKCTLSQLSIVVEPKVLYANYVYRSSVSDTFKKHCRDMARDVRGLLGDGDLLAVDVASNDGCLLEQFKEEEFRVLGFEPCYALVEEARAKGIYTECRYWPKLVKMPEKADVITATNVLAHVDDVKGFVECVRDNLENNGVFIVEVPYGVDMIERNEFDTIYHEHLSYFTAKSLNMLFEICDMKIFKVRKIPIHGGSLRIYAEKY